MGPSHLAHSRQVTSDKRGSLCHLVSFLGRQMKLARILYPEVPGLTLNQDTHRLYWLDASCLLGCALLSGVLCKTPHQGT